MIRAYLVFIEKDLGSRTRLIGRMVDFRYNSKKPCFVYGCCSHRHNRPPLEEMAQSKNFFDDVREELECPVCQEHFSQINIMNQKY